MDTYNLNQAVGRAAGRELLACQRLEYNVDISNFPSSKKRRLIINPLDEKGNLLVRDVQ